MSTLNAYPGGLLILIGVFFFLNKSFKQFYFNYIFINFNNVYPPIAVAFIYKDIFYDI